MSFEEASDDTQQLQISSFGQESESLRIEISTIPELRVRHRHFLQRRLGGQRLHHAIPLRLCSKESRERPPDPSQEGISDENRLASRVSSSVERRTTQGAHRPIRVEESEVGDVLDVDRRAVRRRRFEKSWIGSTSSDWRL